VPNAATDPRINPQVRTFLAELNKDSSPFWELPQQAVDKPGVLFFIHGGVWIAGNFQNHQRLLRDLVVGSGQIGVFVEYTPLPKAKYPTQLEQQFKRPLNMPVTQFVMH
jgi:acetyl esterase